jgi:hypothetical protein
VQRSVFRHPQEAPHRGPASRRRLFALEPGGRWHARLTAYIVREHRRGRQLSDILADRFLLDHASPVAIGHLLHDPSLIHRLADDCLSPFASDGGADV